MLRIAALLLLTAQLWAEVPSATDITVRLASTQVLSSIEIIPVNASIRMCATCLSEPVPAKLDIHGDDRNMLVNGRAAISLLLQGTLRVNAGSQHFVASGRWKISSSADGLHLLLTLPSERYVKGVLLAESATEPIEALKAEAVTIRTFALMNLHRHGLDGLCDSTHCQVLRLDKVPDPIDRAVNETTGETLWHDGRRIDSYFTQSCGGTSAVWPKQAKPWLTVHSDPYCERLGSAWHTDLAEADLRHALNAQGWKLDTAIQQIGVSTRDASGRASRLSVNGIFLDAAAFRFAVNRQLGWNQIRSNLYNLSLQNGHILFQGKGSGHGVGLCQMGAREMAREGMNYRQILGFYFAKTQVRIEPSDNGWRELSFSGAKVRATAAPDIQLPAGIDAKRMIVTIYPTTELFRQATGQPGWMLGSTSGWNVSLQPVAILQQHGGLNQIVRHEAMHAVIESQASPNTPLWMREGLAEFLAGEESEGSMSLREMEQALLHPSSLAASQAAHKAAEARVQILIQQNGLNTVQGWIISGHIPPMQ